MDCLGLGADELQHGYLSDPTGKSDLRILAKLGILLRLAGNHDQCRSFVNGALAEACGSLDGNAVFMARLIGCGHLVVVQVFSVHFCQCWYSACLEGTQGLHFLVRNYRYFLGWALWELVVSFSDSLTIILRHMAVDCGKVATSGRRT